MTWVNINSKWREGQPVTNSPYVIWDNIFAEMPEMLTDLTKFCK